MVMNCPPVKNEIISVINEVILGNGRSNINGRMVQINSKHSSFVNLSSFDKFLKLPNRILPKAEKNENNS